MPQQVTEDVNDKIVEYLNLKNPKSFLLFAGAGSGKTRTLVNVLERIKSQHSLDLVLSGQKVAVITYTNAACEEIKHRLNYDPIFEVSTIHSFLWSLIKPFTSDIKAWLFKNINIEITTLTEKINNAKNPQGKIRLQNISKREILLDKLKLLNEIKSFTYSPDRGKPSKGALNHAEVVKIATSFIMTEPLMKKLLVNSFPILLIDESQDTKKDLLEALISTQQLYKDKFSIGLFGDLMQRIYSGGKEDLTPQKLPSDWKFPSIVENYRCPKRVVKLLNKIRSEVDKHTQNAREDAPTGVIRMFLVQDTLAQKHLLEKSTREKMSELTNDKNWNDITQVKTLVLEHAMAAKRGQFDTFFLPLHNQKKLKDTVLSGKSSTIKFLTEQYIPLIRSIKANSDFRLMELLKRYSPIFLNGNVTLETMQSTSQKIDLITNHISNNDESTLSTLKLIFEEQVLICPDEILPIFESLDDLVGGDDLESAPEINAWEKSLSAKFFELDNYDKYLKEELSFGTHQGVKGLQFNRVMAIIDDDEANGFLFGYEKLMGAEEYSSQDIKNINDGKDSTPERTRRLLYVICSRAISSLSIINYTTNPKAVKSHLLKEGWFNDDEIEII